MGKARTGDWLPEPSAKYHIFSVHTAAFFKGAAGFFYSTHFYLIHIHIAKKYMIFITGVPAVVWVRFFCALVRLPYRVRAPPLRS